MIWHNKTRYGNVVHSTIPEGVRWGIGFILLLLMGCYSSNLVSVQNLSGQYQSQYDYLHPEYYVYHITDSVSKVYYRINLSELLYVRRNVPDSFTAKVNVHCKVTSSYESSVLLDSNNSSLSFTSNTNTLNKFAYGSFLLHLTAGSSYLLNIITTDLMSRKEVETYIPVDKTNPYSADNFLVMKLPSGANEQNKKHENSRNAEVFMNGYSDTAASLSISYNRPSKMLFVNYYKRDFPVAAPPFFDSPLQPFRYKCDSSFVLYPDSSGLFHVVLPASGYYHVQADTSNHEGISLYRFPHYFPTVGEAIQMVAPLRYITSSQEYSKMNNAVNVKKAVEGFWLNIANGNQDRARDLIRIYYNRVEDANRYFTSYLEGWKTDRGMIFLVFGPPSVVYRSLGSETWTYGEDKNFMSITFTFVKTNNPFTSNDYSLQRSPQFRNIWYNSVDVWRQGKVY